MAIEGRNDRTRGVPALLEHRAVYVPRGRRRRLAVGSAALATAMCVTAVTLGLLGGGQPRSTADADPSGDVVVVGGEDLLSAREGSLLAAPGFAVLPASTPTTSAPLLGLTPSPIFAPSLPTATGLASPLLASPLLASLGAPSIVAAPTVLLPTPSAFFPAAAPVRGDPHVRTGRAGGGCAVHRAGGGAARGRHRRRLDPRRRVGAFLDDLEHARVDHQLHHRTGHDHDGAPDDDDRAAGHHHDGAPDDDDRAAGHHHGAAPDDHDDGTASAHDHHGAAPDDHDDGTASAHDHHGAAPDDHDGATGHYHDNRRLAVTTGRSPGPHSAGWRRPADAPPLPGVG